MNLSKTLLNAAILTAAISPVTAMASADLEPSTPLIINYTPTANASGSWSESFYTLTNGLTQIDAVFSTAFTNTGTHVTEGILSDNSGILVDTGNISSVGVTSFLFEKPIAAGDTYTLTIDYTALNNPSPILGSVTIGAVPEASEFAMMLAGLPMLALASRRFKRA